MNFKKYFLSICGVLLISALIVSCSKDDEDTKKPEIELISPQNHDEFHPGDNIHFEARFSDDTELSEYKIDIHFDDGHDHKSHKHDGHEWHYTYTATLSGKNQMVHHDISIPEDAEHGEYHFMVFCTDKAGNESFIKIDIEIEGEHHD